MAELKVITREPGAISFNYEELRDELLEKTSEYKTLAYTSDTIADAKADRAKLNKLKTALNDERIRREREFMSPFLEFKTQINDLIKIIDEPIAIIDKQVKEFDNIEKSAKQKDVELLFSTIPHPEWLEYKQIECTRWYNKSASILSVKEEIEGTITAIERDVANIEHFCPKPAVALQHYRKTLDYTRSMEFGKMAADAEKKEESKPTEVTSSSVEEETKTISFEAVLTRKTAKMLSDFMKANGIQFRRL